MSSDVWKKLALLGVPGVALGVFYGIYRLVNPPFSPVPTSWVGPIVVLSLLLTFAITFAALRLWAPSKGRKPKDGLDSAVGRITRPRKGQAVPRKIDCSGTLHNLPDLAHGWLVVEVDGEFWPKEGELLPDTAGKWKARVFEDGTSNHVSLSLFVVTDKADRTIHNWLECGRKRDSYPGLTATEGMRRLDRVEGLVIQEDEETQDGNGTDDS